MHHSQEEQLINKEIAELIKKARKQHKFTKTALAAKLGISVPQIQKYESNTNRITLGKFVLICRELDINPSEILDSFNTSKESIWTKAREILSFSGEKVSLALEIMKVLEKFEKAKTNRIKDQI